MTAPKKGPKNGCNAISDRQTNRFIHFLQKFFCGWNDFFPLAMVPNGITVFNSDKSLDLLLAHVCKTERKVGLKLRRMSS